MMKAHAHHFAQFVHHNKAYTNRNSAEHNGGKKLTRAEADHHKTAAELHRAAASAASSAVHHNDLHISSPERKDALAHASAKANRHSGHGVEHDFKHVQKHDPGVRPAPGYGKRSSGDPMVTHKGNPMYLD